VGDAQRPGRLRWVAPVAVLVLFALTVAAFGLSQRLKREPLLIDRVVYVAEGVQEGSPFQMVITPNGDCKRDRIVIEFRATRSDIADISVIASDRSTVRTLARNRFLRRYREYRLVWDGAGTDGRPVPPGRYRIRVRLRDNDRDLILPGKIRLREGPPKPPGCQPGVVPGNGGRP
jgi:hypothetical protein